MRRIVLGLLGAIACRPTSTEHTDGAKPVVVAVGARDSGVALVVVPAPSSAIADAGARDTPAAVALDGKAFDRAMVKFMERWWVQPNDMKRTAVYDEARAFERSFFVSSTTVAGWTGFIGHMGKQDLGDDICLMITLGATGSSDAQEKHVTLSQGCLGTPLSPDPNGIKKGTLVYRQLANFNELSPPDCVAFDGEITPHEAHGSNEIEAMKRPSYEMRFTLIRACQGQVR